MADTIIGAHDGTFKTEGSISMREIQEFLSLREGLSASSFESPGLAGSISLQKLYDASNAGEIVLAGNAAYPSSNYSLGGLRGSSYQNNTPPVIDLLGPSVFFVNTDAEVLELPESYITSQQACNPNADLSGYVYNDDHYVIRYVDFRTSNVSGTAVVHEFYVYGSFASSISNFGNSSHTFGSTTFYFIPAGASDLFKTNQCGGYIKVATQIVIPQVFQQAATQLYTALKSAIQNHTLNSIASNYTQSNSYRNYIHPQFCAAVDSRVDVWHKNAVITRKGNAVTNRGATANHLSIINGLSSSGFGSTYNNSAAGEEISIYPIRLS